MTEDVSSYAEIVSHSNLLTRCLFNLLFNWYNYITVRHAKDNYFALVHGAYGLLILWTRFCCARPPFMALQRTSEERQ